MEKRKIELEVIQKKQEKTLKKLQESNEELEQFAYVASHDLQEPLHSIEGYIKLINKEVSLVKSPSLSEFISHTISGVTRMRALIKALLEYSRVGNEAHEVVEIDMEVLMEVVYYNLRRSINETKAEISTNFSAKLVGDRILLMQLFQNLISNAIKFRKEGEIPKIHISCETKDSTWGGSVKDNGIGIEAEQQAQIFSLFSRVASAGKHRGTGIGLAICKKIIEQHKGEIWVDSALGEGSTFYFTLGSKRKS